MSDNLESATEIQDTNIQPADAVAANAEEVTTPQSDNGKFVIEYDEAHGDQDNNAGSVEKKASSDQLYAQMKKAKQKQKAEKEARKAAEERQKELEERIAQLERGNSAQDSPPTLAGCNYDEEVYQKKAAEYYSSKSTVKPQSQKEQQSTHDNYDIDEDELKAEFNLAQSEEAMTSKLPSYKNIKSELLNKFVDVGGNEQILTYFSKISKDAGVDVATAYVGLNSNPNLFQNLISAFNSGSQIKMGKVLAEAAGNVEFEPRRKVDTRPEPELRSGGAIDDREALIQKARKAWQDAPDQQSQIRAWNEYQRVKKS